MIYEEDFKTERDDRARAQTQRAEEGERYREEIARLQRKLNHHQGNLSGVEQIHIARLKELIKAMEDLKKAQEEIQAKTSQVKQYKKQHDQLVAKVMFPTFYYKCKNKMLIDVSSHIHGPGQPPFRSVFAPSARHTSPL